MTDVAGPDLGDLHLGGGVDLGIQPADRLPGVEPQALDVDKAVGRPMSHGLESGDRHAKLPAFGSIGGRHAQRGIGDAKLMGADSRRGTFDHPPHDVATRIRPGEDIVCLDFHAIKAHLEPGLIGCVSEFSQGDTL